MSALSRRRAVALVLTVSVVGLLALSGSSSAKSHARRAATASARHANVTPGQPWRIPTSRR